MKKIAFFRHLTEKNSEGIVVVNTEGIIRYVNPAAEKLLGQGSDKLVGELFGYPVIKDEATEIDLYPHHKCITVEMQAVEATLEKEKIAICSLRDISKRKLAERRLLLTTQILSILNKEDELKKMISDILTLIKEHTGMEAVGIRLKKGDDYPYFVVIGFPDHFVKEEKSLFRRDHHGEIIHDSSGKSVIECLCGNIITDPGGVIRPLLTRGGSFWTNSITRLTDENAELTSLICTRKACQYHQYETMAIIPLRSGNEIVGVLQMNDKRENKLSADVIEFLEGTGHSIGIAFKRMENEKTLLTAKKEAEESDSLKTAFLSNMSHEIRTPLNSIIGFSELLTDQDFELSQLPKFSRLIYDSGNKLLVIINDIMDISKIEVGQVKVKKTIFPLEQVLVDICNEYDFKAKQKGLELNLNSYLPSLLKGTLIKSDKSLLKKILSNILDNAIKFTKKGFIEVEVKIKDNLAHLYVKDTGIGIAKEFHEKIFERFFQVESGLSREFGGNGLGLAISKAYAELLGGTLWVESEPGKGSCFCLTLPHF